MFSLMKHLPPNVVKTASHAGLVAQKHAPIVMFTGGVLGAVTATVLACKATLQLEPILTEATDMLEKIEAAESEAYTPELKRKHMTAVRVKAGVSIAKLYATPAIVGVLSVASLTGSHYIMSQRQAALMSAYAGLDQMYKAYQERVREELGAEKEEHLRRGFVAENFKNDEGKKVKRYKADPNTRSLYAKFFDETNKNWSPDPGSNFAFLKAQQQYMNDLLMMRGHLFLSDVYKALGIEETRESRVVGWMLGHGDNYVDFDIFNVDRTSIRDFVNYNEKSVLLDFNVDGFILDLFDKK